MTVTRVGVVRSGGAAGTSPLSTGSSYGGTPAVGNLLLVALQLYGNATPASITIPSGWEQAAIGPGAILSGTSVRTALLCKVCTSTTETPPAVTVSGANSYRYVTEVWSGLDATSPLIGGTSGGDYTSSGSGGSAGRFVTAGMTQETTQAWGPYEHGNTYQFAQDGTVSEVKFVIPSTASNGGPTAGDTYTIRMCSAGRASVLQSTTWTADGTVGEKTVTVNWPVSAGTSYLFTAENTGNQGASEYREPYNPTDTLQGTTVGGITRVAGGGYASTGLPTDPSGSDFYTDVTFTPAGGGLSGNIDSPSLILPGGPGWIYTASGLRLAASATPSITWGGGSSADAPPAAGTNVLATATQSTSAAGTFTPTMAFTSSSAVLRGETVSAMFKQAGYAAAGPSATYFNGTSEVPATLSIWNGTSEVPVSALAIN